jgi:hypothetical protein
MKGDMKGRTKLGKNTRKPERGTKNCAQNKKNV